MLVELCDWSLVGTGKVWAKQSQQFHFDPHSPDVFLFFIASWRHELEMATPSDNNINKITFFLIN
jgi:hypothetical protein